MKRVLATMALGALAGLCACQSEEKIVKYNPFLAHIPGAETQTKPVGERFENYDDPTKLAGDKTVIENSDGSVTLVAKSVRHLMTNITLCLQYEDDELMLEQVISQQTKERFRAEGKDPAESVKFLKDNQKDVAALFARMPFGEHSPNIILEQPARRTIMLELTGLAAKDMRFTELWAVMEKGNWKLLWIR